MAVSPDVPWLVAVGCFAQLVDGCVGMGYGISASSILATLGVPPAITSATVHAAEMPSAAARRRRSPRGSRAACRSGRPAKSSVLMDGSHLPFVQCLISWGALLSADRPAPGASRPLRLWPPVHLP